jgi:hypothetical protein
VTTGPDGRFRIEVPEEALEERSITITIAAGGFETREVRFRRNREGIDNHGRPDVTVVLERVASQ